MLYGQCIEKKRNMLITMKKLLDVAKKEGGFAVPAPNVFSMETTEAAYQAAREM